MNQFIRIKCPFCGAVLKVRQQPGLERASITCPVCKRKSLFSGFQKVVEQGSEETELPGGSSAGTEKTEVGRPVVSYIGSIVEKSGKRWTLHLGVNTIGRKLQSPPQQVDIPITDYTGEKKMSRCHAKIEVVRLANGAYKHIIYNWQNKNATSIGGDVMEPADRIVLHNGMVVKLANVDVRFVIEDPEATTV